ncbi:VP1 [Gokushovirus WZ-2015a]|nr:VP1 [Gokushovirus WZ-2015a]
MIGNETFSGNPVRLDISRSKYHAQPTITGTFNAGELVPFYIDQDVMPGSSYKVRLRTCIRGSTPVGVPMDNLYMDVFYFFVPNELLLSRQSMSPNVNDSNHSWSAIVGAQDNLLNMPLPDSTATVPAMTLGLGSAAYVGGFWDWTGQSLGAQAVTKVNPLGFLAYCKVWNDFFRDPNGGMNPVTYSISNGGFVEIHGGAFAADSGTAGLINSYSLLPVCRFHGYFGSALPWPQRNATSVTIPVGGSAPISFTDKGLVYVDNLDAMERSNVFNMVVGGANPPSGGSLTAATDLSAASSLPNGAFPNGRFSNLIADLSQAAGITVNRFRQLVQEQRWYEALARSGNNTLGELTAGMFGVTPPTGSSHRAEYLGSKRIALNVIQVNNTAGNNKSTETQSSLGSTGSFMLTNSDDFMFSKSFTSWGVIIGVACVRCDDTFHQGLERQYTRFRKFDYYWPQFANLGEQGILNSEIMLSGNGTADNAIFGYQEYGAEYRMKSNHVCGLIRPGKSLDYWTYTNNFSSVPSLKSFLDARGQVDNIDRTLQVDHKTAGFQFVGQFATEVDYVLPMPTYSIPGLVDHH